MRCFSADYIFSISSHPIKNGIIIVNNNGIIEDVLRPEEFLVLQTSNFKLQTYSGIICPGFVNAHCHLELSHLKNKFSERKGLPHFISEMIGKRKEEREIIATAIADAEDEMIANGIVAVGDICNTTDTISQKKKNRLKYHNFIELFDIHPNRAEEEFKKGLSLLEEFKSLDHPCSITPHAPYSVSKELFRLIDNYNVTYHGLLTIHNQETASENEMFINHSGTLLEKLSSFGTLYNDWKSTGSGSLSYSLNNLSKKNKLLLVHNTYTTKQDLDSILSNIQFCFCPNANLFIENHLPDFSIFMDHNHKLSIGTDSYASNWGLSILDELKTIQKHKVELRLDELLKWATVNSAEFFGWQKEIGSIEKGKRPGLNLITNINPETMALTESSKVRPLLNN